MHRSYAADHRRVAPGGRTRGEVTGKESTSRKGAKTQRRKENKRRSWFSLRLCVRCFLTRMRIVTMKHLASLAVVCLLTVPPAAGQPKPTTLVKGLPRPSAVTVGAGGKVYVTTLGDEKKKGDGRV